MNFINKFILLTNLNNKNNKNNFKIKINKKNKNIKILKFFIKINIIKFVKISEKFVYINICNNNIEFLNLYNKKINLNIKNLKKINIKNFFILSTNLGLISNFESLKKNCGGKLLIKIVIK